MKVNNDFMRKTFKELVATGQWKIERTRSSHFKAIHIQSGKVCFMPSTPSCTRGLMNACAMLRRIERQYRECMPSF